MTAIAILVLILLVTFLKAVFSKDKPTVTPKSPEEIKLQQEKEERRQYESGIRQLEQYGAEQHEKNPNKDRLTDDLPF